MNHSRIAAPRAFFRPRPWTAVAVVALCATACGGPRLEGGVYRDDDASFRVGAEPPGWTRIEIEDGDLAWASNQRGGVMAVNGMCSEADDAPLFVLANHLLFGMTHRTFELRESVTLSGREAFHGVATAELDGVPIKMELYVVKKDGCVYDLHYVSAPDRFENGRPYFQRVVAGFEALGAGG